MSVIEETDYNSASESESSYTLYEDTYVQGLEREIEKLRSELNLRQAHPEWRPRTNAPVPFEIHYRTSVVGC